MLIIILGWLYVLAMVAITAPSVWLGLVIFLFGGLAPVLLWLYLAGSRLRRARSLRADEGTSEDSSASDSDLSPPR